MHTEIIIQVKSEEEDADKPKRKRPGVFTKAYKVLDMQTSTRKLASHTGKYLFCDAGAQETQN